MPRSIFLGALGMAVLTSSCSLLPSEEGKSLWAVLTSCETEQTISTAVGQIGDAGALPAPIEDFAGATCVSADLPVSGAVIAIANKSDDLLEFRSYTNGWPVVHTSCDGELVYFAPDGQESVQINQRFAEALAAEIDC